MKTMAGADIRIISFPPALRDPAIQAAAPQKSSVGLHSI
jgi:hypothetical protein